MLSAKIENNKIFESFEFGDWLFFYHFVGKNEIKHLLLCLPFLIIFNTEMILIEL